MELAAKLPAWRLAHIGVGCGKRVSVSAKNSEAQGMKAPSWYLRNLKAGGAVGDRYGSRFWLSDVLGWSVACRREGIREEDTGDVVLVKSGGRDKMRLD